MRETNNATYSMSEKNSRMFTCILQCKWFFSFLLGTTRGNSTCHVPSLLHAGWRSSNSWRLQRTQTSSDSSINWFTRISIWANDCFYSSCSLSQGHKFTQSCRATPCRLWLQPKPQSPRGPSGNAPQWHEIESPAQSPPQACLLAQQFISINVKPLRLLWLSGVSCQELTSDLTELASSSDMFTDGEGRQLQLQIK